MMYVEILENTDLEKMLGTYTSISGEYMFGLFKKFLEPIYMSNAWDSKAQFYKTLNKLGVNNFIDRYINVSCLRVLDDYQIRDTRYVKFASPNSKYIPEHLQRELNEKFDTTCVNWSEIGGVIHCTCKV